MPPLFSVVRATVFITFAVPDFAHLTPCSFLDYLSSARTVAFLCGSDLKVANSIFRKHRISQRGNNSAGRRFSPLSHTDFGE